MSDSTLFWACQIMALSCAWAATCIKAHHPEAFKPTTLGRDLWRARALR